MTLRRKAAAILTATFMITSISAPAASTQTPRIITPEQQATYVEEFHQDLDRPPVVDGVGGYTEQEIAEIQDTIRKAAHTSHYLASEWGYYNR